MNGGAGVGVRHVALACTVFVAALDSSATEVATQATGEYYRPFTLLSLSRLSGPKGGGAAGPIEVEVDTHAS